MHNKHINPTGDMPVLILYTPIAASGLCFSLGVMEISRFFYKLFLIDGAERPTNFLGSAFPVTPNGGLLTCRHVVNVSVPQGHAIAVFDSERSKLTPIFSAPVYPTNPKIDLAFLPNALGRNKPEFFPLLSPPVLKIGEDIYSFGFFAIGGGVNSVEQGYFAGKIVNFFNHERSIEAASLTLPFAVLEGMSGSPVLTYHNGPKVVGIAIGNRSSRILASEVSIPRQSRGLYDCWPLKGA